ncbi:Vms1/Ankzf1 family peptidyl-tRNA hydrolase [Kocuria atrinae]|uniref:Vms1/Ankzf1 family peptidyl-tRNA hydrolase n=1 Tax=Kocuria atrinae TaxID=592377 RepID=A0ABP5J9U9_9MICC
MNLSWLTPVLENDGPFLSIYIDSTRTDPSSASGLSTRWGNFRSKLADDGAPDEILEEIEETLLEPSPIGGRHGRAILATGSAILVDRVLPAPPRQDSAHWGDEPVLVPLLQVIPTGVRQLLVEVDRSGADLHLRAPENPTITKNDNGLGEDASVDGGHDELHKASVGGGSQHGWRSSNQEARVEDSWERNAEAVASKVDSIVRDRQLDMLLLTGDVRAESLLKDELSKEALAILKEVPGGTRGVSLDRASFREEMARVTEEFIKNRQQSLADLFTENQNRGGESVAGSTEVAEALQRGQVSELILTIGAEPENAEELARQALATDAGISTLGSEYVDLPDGVGALLRWRDEATPSNSLSSMSGDHGRETAVDPDSQESPRGQEEESIRQ